MRVYYRNDKGRFIVGSPEEPLLNPVFKGINKDLEHVFFKGDSEPNICSQFGCGKYLTPIENLAGTKCTQCMGKKKVGIDQVLQYPHKK